MDSNSDLKIALAETIDRLPTINNGNLIAGVLEAIVRLAAADIDRIDWKLLSATVGDMERAFGVFQSYQHVRKVAVFGSARTSSTAPEYQLAQDFARLMTEQGWMTITGAGGGIMAAANAGAGAEHSFGLNIQLPYEQGANEFIAGDPKSIEFKYFFTRKLFFLRDHVSDRRRIMHVKAINAARVLRELLIKRCDSRQMLRQRIAGLPERLQVSPVHPGLFRDIQPDHRHRPVCREHDVGRLRVVVNVRLCRRGRIARHHRIATHQHDLVNQTGDARLELQGQSDVRQWSDRNKRDFARSLQDLLDHKFGSGLRNRTARGWRKVHVALPIVAMNERHRPGIRSSQRHTRTVRHGNIVSSRNLEEAQGIDGCQICMDVAKDGRQPDHIDFC